MTTRPPRFLLLLLLACAACAQSPSPAVSSGHTPGLRNFHQVDSHIFRGAQPAAWGYSALAGMGIHTVIDLRGEGIAALLEKKLVQADGMNYLHIPLDGHKAPTDAEIARLLSVLDDSSQWPVFIHCRRGADRTGTVIACYRMAHDRWDRDAALAEAMSFGMDPKQVHMRAYILSFTPVARALLPAEPGLIPAPVAFSRK